MKIYKLNPLFGKPGVGYVFVENNDIKLLGISGLNSEFKAEVFWPNIDFSVAEELDNENRANVMRLIVKSALSKKTKDEFITAYIEILKFFNALESSLEGSWIQLHLMDCGCTYVDSTGMQQSSYGNKKNQ